MEDAPSLGCLSWILAFFAALFAFVVSPACKQPTVQPSEIHIAAASDLTSAFEEIGRDFEIANHTKVIFSFGSTGLLTRQIENGAPMDAFAAANVDFIDQLDKKGLIFSDTKSVYARGRITLWTSKDSKIRIEKLQDLSQDAVKRIAIANPDHAPYGMAAREALQSTGIWDVVKPKLVYADNIRQTLQFAESGNVDVAIVALSLSVQSNGQWVVVPAELHKPINQAMAVIKGTKNESATRQFISFVVSEKAQAILAKYGFEKP